MATELLQYPTLKDVFFYHNSNIFKYAPKTLLKRNISKYIQEEDLVDIQKLRVFLDTINEENFD